MSKKIKVTLTFTQVKGLESRISTYLNKHSFMYKAGISTHYHDLQAFVLTKVLSRIIRKKWNFDKPHQSLLLEQVEVNAIYNSVELLDNHHNPQKFTDSKIIRNE